MKGNAVVTFDGATTGDAETADLKTSEVDGRSGTVR
jgi:hypothetical protein